MLGNRKKFAARLLGWYDAARRDLLWRVPLGRLPDAYHVLVSEAMLQQTQIATVLPYFRRFLEKFPTIQSLADSEEQDVLLAWQGLGYYSRARNLRLAARKIVVEHGGKIPSDVETLLQLPGVGRYTAGAVASIAYDTRAPIVDGNVARVLTRIECIESDPKDRATQAKLWQVAEAIVPMSRAGDFNSALMELGGRICTPRAPKCLSCPVAKNCQALAAGVQEKIPPPKKAKPPPLFVRHVLCISRKRHNQTEWLIEQRPPKGRWAGLWQFITYDPTTNGLDTPIGGSADANHEKIHTFTHALTHRRYKFEVYRSKAKIKSSTGNQKRYAWIGLRCVGTYPMSRPHQLIAQNLSSHSD